MEVKVASAVIKAVENVNAADTSQTVYVFRLPPGAYVIATGGRVKTAFAGVTLPTVKLGESGETSKYLVDQPISSAGDLVVGPVLNSISYCDKVHPGGWVKTETNRSVIATFTSASGNLSSLSAGEIEFFAVYVD